MKNECSVYKTTVVGIGPWCVEFPDGEIITTKTEERAKAIAATLNRNQKCCFKNCERYGVPETGFDFYACNKCCEELERLLIAKATDEAAHE